MERVAVERDEDEHDGVTLLGVDEDRIVWGRLYMEPVEEGGEDIDESVHSITEGA